MLHKRALITSTLTSVFLISCASGPKYSNLPRSELEVGKVVNGSAIAFQGKAAGCAQMTLSLAPELEPGKFGKTKKLGLGWTNIALPTNWSFHGNGKTLHRYELAPGKYAVAHLACTNSQSVMDTPPALKVKYGNFEVVAGKTTYIGNIQTGANQRTRRFNFTVIDDSNQAKIDFAKKHPKRSDEFQIGLMTTNAAIDDTFKELLDQLMKTKAAKAAATNSP